MSQKENFHFIGICGTAMGSVAAALVARGHRVTGSDENVYPPMSTFLQEQGIEIASGYRAENIPDDADIVVIGNAISRGNEEAEAVLESKRLYYSLPETLKNTVLRGKTNLVVTGTHGKTTTSSLLAWLMKNAERDPSWMIGGIPANLGKGGYFTDSQHTVLEGDEYDTAFFDKRSKFLHYLPEIVVINNIEFDHADIYDSVEQIKLSFERLLRVVPRTGVAIVNGDEKNCLDVTEGAFCEVVTLGLGEPCSLRITEIDYEKDGSSFTLDGERYEIPMVGEFNVRNAAMAVTAARRAGLTPDECRSGLVSFEGIARRQQVRGVEGGVTVVDDFAHHPTAIALAVDALRQKFPGQKLWVLFEPRSNTTIRNIFQDELVTALAKADEVIVSAIENPDKVGANEKLDVKKLMADITAAGAPAQAIEGVDAIVTDVLARVQQGDVLAVLSNGGFGGIHDKLLVGLKS